MVDKTLSRIPISAGWVLGRVPEGKEIRLRNAIIDGDLDLNKLKLPTRRLKRTELQKQMGLADDVKIVRSAISIANSSILGKLDFRNTIFIEHAIFEEYLLAVVPRSSEHHSLGLPLKEYFRRASLVRWSNFTTMMPCSVEQLSAGEPFLKEQLSVAKPSSTSNSWRFCRFQRSTVLQWCMVRKSNLPRSCRIRRSNFQRACIVQQNNFW